eukprot:TRINITY_DN3536_c0_g1_i1.p1 TRINITY_DN3536_c0_g1~~TRINITY_DN3536_c0_g1_i1.p1  ORF type:complete len:667 (+),score=190.76 TRINITY_DN3536_c0_g1_i1:153-2153(+)
MSATRRLVLALATFASSLVKVTRCAPSAASISPEMQKLVQDLDAAKTEEEGRTLVEPYMAELKKLDPTAMEKIVLRQWWAVAKEVVAKSHLQQVDLSFSVRKAVRTLKDEADELLRTLNPKYGQAQQVSPAFQWAQNDTCVFLTVKYTVRWNAPGALEATDINVQMSGSSFNFTGLGKHSNNKYRYVLSLPLFDNIREESSSWSAASVGKLSVTLRKRWPRKWPRLLGDKKMKITNMHVWSERQEQFDSSLTGMNSVSNSPVTCGAADKLYCLATDTCKKAANCSQCPGKPMAVPEESLCAGVPTEKGSLSFKDSDMDVNELGGEIKITKARNEFDIDQYIVYFGKDENTKLQTADGKDMEIGQATPIGGDSEVKMPMNTPVPDGATHLLVFSKNQYGEYGTPGSVIISDAVLPKGKPESISFEDQDGDRGHISGHVTIEGPLGEQLIDEFALHWGKSSTKRITQNSLIRTISAWNNRKENKAEDDKEKGEDKKDEKKKDTFSVKHYFSYNTKIPDGATHLIAYAKNSHGEHPTGVSVRLYDRIKPCLNKTDASCPQSVALSGANNAVVPTLSTLKESDSFITVYGLYWGRGDCKEGGQSGAKNGHIQDLNYWPTDSSPIEHILPAGSAVPDGTTHVLVFAKGAVGESGHCVSASFAPEEKTNTEL